METKDNSPSLILGSDELNEMMHNSYGAFKESLYIYESALIQAHNEQNLPLSVYSLGLGLAYNEWISMGYCLKHNLSLKLQTSESEEWLYHVLKQVVGLEQLSEEFKDVYQAMERVIELVCVHYDLKSMELIQFAQSLLNSSSWQLYSSLTKESVMATLYKNRGIWYITACNGYKRITKSLKTKDKRVAKKLKPGVELELLSLLSGVKQQIKNLPFDDLVSHYLKADHNWSKSTKELNDYVFKSYLSNKPLPINRTSRAIFVRTINACWNWGLKNHFIHEAYKIPGDTKGESRVRTYTAAELKLMFAEINDGSFNAFVRFAYYFTVKRVRVTFKLSFILCSHC